MRRQRGFSLLETIAAMLLLAIVFGTLMKISSGSLHATSMVRTRDQAAMWVDSKLEALGHTEPLAEGSTSGRFEGGYDWRMGIERLPGGPDELRLYRVRLDVSWQEAARPARLSFTTLKLETAIPAPAATTGEPE
ncbi:type II secretion system protein [Luteibacter pinisoli]|uniref:Type II secretion system protein n=1 Tax=Luteibacter pinisoli TaxID=2589080 RepID=A0A4Y5Z6I0_9GAMM|nr:type II secretion system protein [Luteibacter pinisoli]QDE40005.1 type II secretion system protein [Luteibacter pinisoli]